MIKKLTHHLLVTAFCLLLAQIAFAQNDYPNTNQVKQRLQQLQQQNAGVSLQSLTKTIGGQDIWAMTIAEGDPAEKPGIAVLGGIEGDHLLSVELALRFAEDLVKNQKELLKKSTFYIFPNMSPDASQQYFANLKYARKGNARSTDDDRDGDVNEDPFEDLNGDGVITLLRVKDPTGSYIPHPADNRVMIKANKSKAEKGSYQIYTEGIDNDGDEKWNEDGIGGIAFNKNMSFKFPYFQPGAGEHSVSEKENRALLDFLYEKWNLYAVISFAPQNNLSTPLKYNSQGASKRVVTSILKKDEGLNKMLSDRYKELTGFKGGDANKVKGGDFFQWAYFHFGKLSLSTPGWWVPEVKIEKGDSITIPNKDKNKEVNYLRWAKKEGLTDYFAEWTAVEHPDFSGKNVEVGGIYPYVMANPPFEMVGDIAKANNAFIYEIVTLQQQVKITNVETKATEKLLTRITVDLYNEGLLPTHTEMGEKSRWLRRVKVEMETGKDQAILSGKKIELINRIDGDQSIRLSWLIKGKGTVKIKAGAPHTGSDEMIVELNK